MTDNHSYGDLRIAIMERADGRNHTKLAKFWVVATYCGGTTSAYIDYKGCNFVMSQFLYTICTTIPELESTPRKNTSANARI